MLIAFVLSLFFKAPPLRQRSALQEQADQHAAQVEAEKAAAERTDDEVIAELEERVKS
jgi:hypothetical protein